MQAPGGSGIVRGSTRWIIPWNGGLLLTTPLGGYRAEDLCMRWFDQPIRKCSGCRSSLPATFFHRGKAKCISCRREENRRYRERVVPVAPPDEKQCLRCLRTQPAACFAKRADKATGLQQYCRPCSIAATHELRQLRRQVPLAAAMQAPQRRCSVCQLAKPRSAFHKDPAFSSGVRSHCKPCAAVYRQARRASKTAAA